MSPRTFPAVVALFSVVVLAIAVGVGGSIGYSRGRGDAAIAWTPVTDPTNVLITERELREYSELRTLRERYEKADELLGKALLLLIAHRAITLSDESRARAEAASRGPPTPVGEPRPAIHPSPSASPIPSPGPSPSPIANAVVNASPTPSPSPSASLLPSGAFARAGANAMRFDSLEYRGRRGCDQKTTGWFTAGENPEDYEMGLDRTARGAEPGAFIRARRTNPRGHAEINHCLETAGALGKSIRFSIWVRGEGVRDYANLHFRVEDENHERVRDQRVTFRGDFDWRELSVELDVPARATTLIYGVTFESAGRVQIRNANLAILGAARTNE